MIDFKDLDEYEWGDFRFDLEGGRIIKLTGFKMSTEIDKELLFAEGNTPRGVQFGNRSYAGEISLLVGALIDMNDFAIVAGGKDILDLKNLVGTLRLRPKNARGRRMFVASGISVTKYELSMAQGDKKMEVTLPIIFTDFQQL